MINGQWLMIKYQCGSSYTSSITFFAARQICGYFSLPSYSFQDHINVNLDLNWDEDEEVSSEHDNQRTC